MTKLSCPDNPPTSPPKPDEAPSPSPVRPVQPGHVLLIDDDPAVVRLLEFELAEAGVSTVAASDGRQAFEVLEKSDVDAIVLDLALPDIPGRTLLRDFQRDYADIPIIVLTARDEVDEAVRCMQLGARDFVTKPFDRTRLLTSVANACKERRMKAKLEQVSGQRRKSEGFASLVGVSSGIDKVKKLLERAVGNDVTVLIEGESGTGKEVFARALHAEGARASGPFVAVNCGAIPESLIESQLFGHARGAFTGAIEDHVGYFEQAEGGTILLDEIGELPLASQIRLLRVLQERSVQRVGDQQQRKIDVRVVAATNRNLESMAKSGHFRLDLFYRIAVFPVTLPPLYQRAGDGLLLSEAFLERTCQRLGRSRLRLDESAKDAIGRYNWPGNVRELENAIERACLLASSEKVTASDLPDAVLEKLLEDDSAAAGDSGSLATTGQVRPLADEERRLILRALELTDWNLSQAAQQLGIGRATIYRKIDRYGLSRENDATVE
jgi:DNA-binding NtrC family response regulator